MRAVDITGRRYGRLVAMWPAGYQQYPNRKRRIVWLFVCDCGSYHPALSDSVRGGLTQSCGCLNSETLGNSRRTHGLSKSVEYKTYYAARHRCLTSEQDRKYYRDRGIEFKFTSFKQFYDEVGPRPSAEHSIDRIDNSGHYEPGNIRWATPEQQHNNQRQRGTA